ncbi:MAG: hypothetical protein HY514_01130 [Candidatus Aenigmarchaeota archaeon]|nr:hypothetical protein [Candidatus Aenigmarchaeota archaeon]
MSKILIVEDQSRPLEALEFAVNKVMPAHYAGFSKGDYDVARCYADTKRRISESNYQMVLLDNRMPYEDQGDLERTDFDRFCSSLENIGYALIPVIKEKNPNTVIVGTSSLSKGELRGLPTPDYTMSKMWGDAETDLESVLNKIKGATE